MVLKNLLNNYTGYLTNEFYFEIYFKKSIIFQIPLSYQRQILKTPIYNYKLNFKSHPNNSDNKFPIETPSSN